MCQPKRPWRRPPLQTIETLALGTRVEVKIAGGSSFIGAPGCHTVIYDNPDQALADAVGFLNDALSARQEARRAERGRDAG